MNLTTRDRIATTFVASAVVIYGLWLAGFAGGLSAGSIAIAVLVLGVLASISAVVPGFWALLAGSRAYLGLASLGGLVAFGSGIATVANATAGTLAVLVGATVVLWFVATLRHATVGQRQGLAVG